MTSETDTCSHVLCGLLGNVEADQVLKVLLGTAMFVGGVVAFFLDNTVPGTPEERGIIKWRQLADSATYAGKGDNSEQQHATRIYGFPPLTACLDRLRCCRYVPFMPTFAFKRVSPFKWLSGKLAGRK